MKRFFSIMAILTLLFVGTFTVLTACENCDGDAQSIVSQIQEDVSCETINLDENIYYLEISFYRSSEFDNNYNLDDKNYCKLFAEKGFKFYMNTDRDFKKYRSSTNNKTQILNSYKNTSYYLLC